MFCHTGLGHYGHHPDPGEVDLPPETQPTPPSATLVGTTITHLRDPDHHTGGLYRRSFTYFKPWAPAERQVDEPRIAEQHFQGRASFSFSFLSIFHFFFFFFLFKFFPL
jgi:hypothetical protein